MRSILHLSPETEIAEVWSASVVDGALEVRLSALDGELVGARRLPATGTCDELVQASAVVLATWLSDVHPSYAAQLGPGAASSTSHGTFDAAAPSLPEHEVATSGPAAQAQAPQPAPSRRLAPSNRYRLEAAIGVAADLTAGSAALGAAFSGALQPKTRGLAVQLLGKWSISRSEDLDRGRVIWSRWGAALMPSLRVPVSPLRWDLGAGVSLAWMRLAGESFAKVSSVDATAWGAVLAARVSTERGVWRPFGLVSAWWWRADVVAFARGSEPTFLLPKLDFLVAAGLCLGPSSE